MDRRAFMGLAAAAVTAAPGLARAQAPRRRPLIGVLAPGSPQFYAPRISALRAGLAERGYTEPATLEMVFRYGGERDDQLPALAGELVAAKPDVIVTSSTPAIRAVMTATKTIPIVMSGVADAVASGLVASLARPGGNVTGLTLLIPELSAKQVQLLGELVPGIKRIGVLRARGEGANAAETLRTAVTAQGLSARFEEITSADGIAPAIAAIAKAGCQALIVVDGPLPNRHSAAIARRAEAARLPTISTLRLYVDSGTLAAYGPPADATWRRAAYFVDRILKGANPADLPVEQPTKFELVINVKTAKALGLTIPQSLLGRADHVVP